MYLGKMKDSSFIIVFIILALIDAFILMIFCNYALAWFLNVVINVSFGKSLFVVLLVYLIRIAGEIKADK